MRGPSSRGSTRGLKLVRAATRLRPDPPASPRRSAIPAPDLASWIFATFVLEGAPLFNPRHRHLLAAQLGVLWARVPNVSKGRVVAGTAEIPRAPQGVNAWGRAQYFEQLVDWFGFVPDFKITISIEAALRYDDSSFCALVEHELCHCAQARDRFGAPLFRRDGRPKFTIRGHDFEEFEDVARRYGVESVAGEGMLAALRGTPTIAPAAIAAACGECLRRAA